jgi:hypothetical protein
MTRLVLCIVALVAASVGQQQTPKPAGDIFDRVAAQSSAKPSSGEIPPPPSGFTVDPSEVTPVSQSVQKETVQNSRSKPPTALDMRPAAVCAREMGDALDGLDANNAVEMEQSQRESLHQRALDCLSLQQSARALRVTALVLNETALSLAFNNGFDFGTKQAAEAQAASKIAVCAREIRDEIQNIQRVNAKTETGTKDFARMGKSQLEDLEKQAYDCLMQSETTQLAAFILDQTTWYQAYDATWERDKADYNALVIDYNSLVNKYNTLLGLANSLASRPTIITVPSFTPPPPPRELYLNCTAMALPGNMATVNCW